MVEVVPVSWDHENDEPQRPLDAHLEVVRGQLVTSWGLSDDVYVDFRLLAADELVNGKIHPLTWLFDECRRDNIKTIPATSPRRDQAYQTAVADAIRKDRRGVCVRLGNNEMFSGDLTTIIKGLLVNLNVDPQDVDLVLDLGVLTPDDGPRSASAILGMLLTLPEAEKWRTLTCAGTAFPEDMRKLKAGMHKLPRAEWHVWKLLLAAKAKLPRLPMFGDYAIAHPDLSEIDPRMMTMSANIRYTIDSEWLILRGKSLEKYGSTQFNEFCAALVGTPEFSGANFSAGDYYISRCAVGSAGPGNATTWRKVATNHHITFVSRQLASVTAASS
jgi:hypothetical protein